MKSNAGRNLAASLCVALLWLPLAAPAAAKPNSVFILADDLASYELGCYGGKNVATPNLDRLAGQGMRFTQAFASEAMCVPIRSSSRSGKYLSAIRSSGSMRSI